MHNRYALWRLWLAIAGVTTLAAWPQAAVASRPLGLSLASLVRDSDATLLGHTLSLRSYWQGPRIVTVTTVAVDELWAGSLSGRGTVDVVTLGGMVGEYGQRVDGAGTVPSYGRVVLHISRIANNEYAPFGMAEGVWHVDGLWGDASRVRRDVPHAPLAAAGQSPLTFAARPHDTVAALRAAVSHAKAAP